MPRFVVLLRGVNVGKANRMLMADFKALLQGLGYTDVATVLNSGNAVFTSSGRSTSKHSERIAAALAESMGISTSVVVKSSAELSAAMAANPIPVPAQDHAKFLVAFANEHAALQGLSSLQSLVKQPERLAVTQHAAYLHCAEGILKSRVAAAMLGKAGKAVTTRNWATALQLLSLVACGAA